MNFKLMFIFCLFSFLIFVNHVESMPNKSHTFHPHFHFILTQTNCSSDDLKCHNSIKIFNLSVKDDKNSTTVDINQDKCDGHKYFDAHRKECVNCTANCPLNARIEKKCNQTHDIQCVCNSGFFMTIDSGCKPCSQCEPGWGIWRTCWGSRNTVCRKCPPGTYSGVKTGTLGCILCTKCNSREVMLEECSGVHDSICIDKRKLIHSLNYTKADNFLDEEGNRLPIYVGFLIIIILVLVTYFIFQLRIKQIVKSGPNLKSQQKFKQPNAYHNLYNNTYTQRQYNYNQIVKNDKQFDNYYVYNEIPQSFSVVKRYNELNTSVRRNFEVKLNSESHSWKDLAKHLGYTPESISMFERLGRQHMNCVQYFLTDWSKRENASIHSLLKALQKINRLDCVPIIDPHFRVSPY